MLDAAQIMRQALQAGRFDTLQNAAFSATQTNKAAVESGQAMGFTLQVMDDPAADLMDSMEELSFQFEEKTLKSVAERKLGEIRSAQSAYVMAVETWQKTMPDMPGGAFMERMLRQLRQAMQSGQSPDANGLLKMRAKAHATRLTSSRCLTFSKRPSGLMRRISRGFLSRRRAN